MNKAEFIAALSDRLAQLPQVEIDKSVDYYAEIIDDRMEDGVSEEDAVPSPEELDDIVEKIMYEIPLPVLMKARMKPKKPLSVVNIVLLVLGFPVWFPLLIAAFAVFFSFYVTVWAIIISLYATVLALGVAGIAAIIFSPMAFSSGLPSGVFTIGCGLLSIGLGVLLFFPVTELSKLLIRLTAWFMKKVKALFIQKEVA